MAVPNAGAYQSRQQKEGSLQLTMDAPRLDWALSIPARLPISLGG
jgi:hypothetical protein